MFSAELKLICGNFAIKFVFATTALTNKSASDVVEIDLSLIDETGDVDWQRPDSKAEK